MKDTFYDVKLRKKVEAEVVDKVKYENGRYALKAKTADGRSLTKFVSAADYEKAAVCAAKACGCKAAPKAAKKK